MKLYNIKRNKELYDTNITTKNNLIPVSKKIIPLKCNLCEVGKGCQIISLHIKNAAESANILLQISQERNQPELLKSAKVMNLIAFEESGKLFMLWQEAARSEREKRTTLEVYGYYDHPPKGEKAGDLFYQMVDTTLNEIIKMLDDPKNETKTIFDYFATILLKNIFSTTLNEYKQHLILIGNNLKNIREDLMHTDYFNGTWSKEDDYDTSFIYLDSYLFKTVADFSLKYLDSGERFSLATQALVDIKEGKESEATARFSKMFEHN